MAQKYELEFRKYKDGFGQPSVRQTHMGPDIDEALQDLDDKLTANDPDYPDASIFFNEKREDVGIWEIVKVNTDFTPAVVYRVTVSRIP